MAVFGISITKELEWRGQQHRVSNVYHYHTSDGQTFPDSAAIDEVVRLEKLVFASAVKFVTGRTWGPTEQGPVASVTRSIKDLTGFGSVAATTGMYKEAAILVSWPLGRYGTRNRPQYLRKFLHTLAAHGYDTNGSTPMTAQPAAGSALQTYMEGIRVLNPAGFVGGLDLSTDGDRVNIGAGRTYPYLEHRQIGR